MGGYGRVVYIAAGIACTGKPMTVLHSRACLSTDICTYNVCVFVWGPWYNHINLEVLHVIVLTATCILQEARIRDQALTMIRQWHIEFQQNPKYNAVSKVRSYVFCLHSCEVLTCMRVGGGYVDATLKDNIQHIPIL